MDPISSFFTLLFVMDPLGNIPIFLSILKNADKRRRTWIIFREMLIALTIMSGFLLCGSTFLSALSLNQQTLQISGAIVLMIIAIRMIFPHQDGIMGVDKFDGEPFIVPLAIPMVAGPSLLAILMLKVHDKTTTLTTTFLTMSAAWFVSLVIFLLSPILYRFLKERGLVAVERLMGMILVMISVQMGLDGIVAVIAGH